VHFQIRPSEENVIITSFGDFRQFSAKKLAFLLKTNAMINILHKIADYVLCYVFGKISLPSGLKPFAVPYFH
jgi:hypothetical protein